MLNHQRTTHLRRHSGFTLIELMITVAVLGVLAAVAFPSYQQYIERSRRTDGKAALLRTAQWLERAASVSGSYLDGAGAARDLSAAGLASSEAGHYAISYSGVPTATAFTLQAQPNNWTDSLCGTLTVTQGGVKGESGTATVADCWNK